jgi:hypothetical protein
MSRCAGIDWCVCLDGGCTRGCAHGDGLRLELNQLMSECMIGRWPIKMTFRWQCTAFDAFFFRLQAWTPIHWTESLLSLPMHSLCLDNDPNIPDLYPVPTTSANPNQPKWYSGGRRKPASATTATRSPDSRGASSQRSDDPDAHTRACVCAVMLPTDDDTLLSLKRRAARFLGMYDSEL